jgi:cytochrome b subunit of formate dehydrogenase
MCDYVPVEYRYEAVKRVVDTVACAALVLCGVSGMTIAILGLAYPASSGSASMS